MGVSGHQCPVGVTEPEKQPPLRHGGWQAYFGAANSAALLTMFAVFNRQKSGLGEHIDISEQEAVLNHIRPLLSNWLIDNVKDGRRRSERESPAIPLPCKDGYVFYCLVTEPQWQAFKSMIGSGLDWVTEELYPNRWARNANWDAIEPIVIEWMAEHTKEEIIQEGRDRHFVIGPVNTAEDVVKSEQLAYRGFFVDVDHPEAGRIKLPGLPYKMSQTPWQVNRPAPLLGQHNEEVFCQRLGYSKQDLVRMRQAGVI